MCVYNIFWLCIVKINMEMSNSTLSKSHQVMQFYKNEELKLFSLD